jgi:CO/xanthine dehydrogenase Mo-binding subunit
MFSRKSRTAAKSAVAGNAVVATNEGDFKKAMSGAAKALEARYEAPLLAHGTMEPMTCTAWVTADRCNIWVGTQVISRVQSAVAEATGLPAGKVRVHNFLMGGAFGRRLETDYAVQAASTVFLTMLVDGAVTIPGVETHRLDGGGTDPGAQQLGNEGKCSRVLQHWAARRLFYRTPENH